MLYRSKPNGKQRTEQNHNYLTHTKIQQHTVRNFTLHHPVFINLLKKRPEPTLFQPKYLTHTKIQHHTVRNFALNHFFFIKLKKKRPDKRSSYSVSKEFLEKPSYKLHDVYRALDILGTECDFIQAEPVVFSYSSHLFTTIITPFPAS